MIRLSEVLEMYNSADVNAFLKKQGVCTLDEKNLKLKDIEEAWKFLGNNSSNASAVEILKSGEKGLIERITNAVDAVIEKKKTECGIERANSVDAILKVAFPKYFNQRGRIHRGEDTKSQSYDASDQVILAINDSGRSTKPTFDVVDKGTGIDGKEFAETILSIQHGNKISSDKGYLIGAFGQGGSTSLPFTTSTLVVSKYDGEFFFTIIKAANLEEYKNHCFVYFTEKGEIPHLANDHLEYSDQYINEFIQSESGTLIRMIEMDISAQLRNNDITKPGMLVDYINTELFDVSLPIKLIENRDAYAEHGSTQNRNSFGSQTRLQTSKLVRKEYCGTLDIDINNRPYKIDYYTILPSKEEDWGKDGEARKNFVQFNATSDPIIYTVNGQMITSEGFTKIKNAGLHFMRYRLLVVINLDVLGPEKYKFFTTDRNQIKNTDQTKGFLDKVVAALTNIDKLKEINGIIAEKAINNNVDNELVGEISQEVKGIYNKYLKKGIVVPGGGGNRPGPHPTPEEDYYDSIQDLEIATTKDTFYKDQSINIIVKTGAQKHINQGALIYSYIDGKGNYNATPSFMNGRIQYSWAASSLKVGVHQLQFRYYLDNEEKMASNIISFEILDEKSPNKKREQQKELNLEIKIVNEQELICDVVKNKQEGSIVIKVCLESDIMTEKIYGYTTSAEEIKEVQARIIKPIVLYALFLEDIYENMENADDKNALIISHLKAYLAA